MQKKSVNTFHEF